MSSVLLDIQINSECTWTALGLHLEYSYLKGILLRMFRIHLDYTWNMRNELGMHLELWGSVKCCPWTWSPTKASLFCGTCCCWGHHTHACKSKHPWCTSCGGSHLTTSHSAAAAANASHNHLLCLNCHEEHSLFHMTAHSTRPASPPPSSSF